MGSLDYNTIFAENYEETLYEELKNGKHQVIKTSKAYMCPFCPNKRSHSFLYKDILQHANSISTCSSERRTARDKVNHLVLAKYLETDIAVKDPDRPKPSSAVVDVVDDVLQNHDHYEKFVWPYIGIIVNIPTEFKDGHYVGKSGTELRNQLVNRGFNPTRVLILWKSQGHSGIAIVEFHRDLSGFKEAMRFEKIFEDNNCGKSGWLKENENKSGLYTWVARAEDYNSNNIIGENIRKVGDLRTISDIMGEEALNSLLCPYCPTTRMRNFVYKDLLQHASSIGECFSKKRTKRDKANHQALAQYLEKNVSIDVGSPKPSVVLNWSNDNYVRCKVYAQEDNNELFVWPWIGIIVNIPTELKDGRYVGQSASKLRDQLIERGFNPRKVRILWNDHGHSGTAIVEFRKDWSGFTSVLSFGKAYEVNHHGKINWMAENEEKSGMYAWVACADDYNFDDMIGECLRKIGDLRTIPDIMEEDARMTNILLSNLTNSIDEKTVHLLEMENKVKEVESLLSQLSLENDSLHQAYSKEMRKIESGARDHFQKILKNHEEMKLRLDPQKRDLELQAQELAKREAHNEIERKKLAEEIEQKARNCALQTAQRKADENMMKLAEEHKKEKEKHMKKIAQLEKQLDAKQAVQLEIEILRCELNAAKQRGDASDLEALNIVETLQKERREKERKFEELESLNQTLIVQEHMTNIELQDARKEMVNGLREMPIKSYIGIKRMGELDIKPFYEAMKRNYNEAEAEEKATELCSLWEKYLRDPDWHPIKVVDTNGKYEAVIREDDEKLTELRQDYGEEVYNAVTTALYEIYEYNSSGMYITSQLWNYTEGRRANLKEGCDTVLMEWKSQLRSKKRRRITD